MLFAREAIDLIGNHMIYIVLISGIILCAIIFWLLQPAYKHINHKELDDFVRVIRFLINGTSCNSVLTLCNKHSQSIVQFIKYIDDNTLHFYYHLPCTQYVSNQFEEIIANFDKDDIALHLSDPKKPKTSKSINIYWKNPMEDDIKQAAIIAQSTFNLLGVDNKEYLSVRFRDLHDFDMVIYDLESPRES
jgi:hypothetical protein